MARLVLWDIDGTLMNVAGFGRRVAAQAYQQVCQAPLLADVPMAGRTDRAILLDLLAAHGHDVAYLEPLCQAIGVLAQAHRAEVRAGGGRDLPGALAAINALAAQPGVTQSVLTGNLRALALVKLEALGFLDRLDLQLAAFGDHHVVRADLVQIARAAFLARHQTAPEIVLVGDTPLDVEAARQSRTAIVAVATGRYSAAELTAAGAPVVLPDLSDTARVVAAVLDARPLTPAS